MSLDFVFEHCVTVPWSGCWLYDGYVDWRGYARLRIDGKVRRLHRYALEQRLGRPLKRHEHACHTCDNPECCNPDHLFAASNRVNSADRVAKGRHVTRPKVLTYDAAIVMRAARSTGVGVGVISSAFGVSRKHVEKVLANKRWRSGDASK